MASDLLRAKIEGSFLLLLAGSWLIYSGIKRHRKVRAVEDHPCSKTETAAQGLTEFQGFAWSMSEGPKNFNGRELVYHHFELQKYVKEGRGKNRRRTWRTVFSAGYKAPFYILDATGMAIVDPMDAELHFRSTTTRRWEMLSKVQQNYYIGNIIHDGISGFPPSNILFGLFSSKFRVVETELHEGAPLYVKGDFRSEPEACYKTRRQGLTKFSERFFDCKRRSLRKVDSLLDINKDGKISYRELLNGYTRFAGFCRSKSPADLSMEAEASVFGLISSSSDHRLLIADTHQEQLVDDLGRWNILRIIVGGLLITAAVAVFFFSFP